MHPVPLIIRPVTEVVPRPSIVRFRLRKRKRKTLSGAIPCSSERDDKESLVLSAGLSTRGCCSSARRAETHGAAASAWKFMLIESEAAATSASSLPAHFSLRRFFLFFPTPPPTKTNDLSPSLRCLGKCGLGLLIRSG